MHSKYKIWDFINQNPNTLDKFTNGIISIYSYEQLFKQSLTNNIFNKLSRDEFRSVTAKEVTIGWVEDNLKSLGLFGNNDSFIISAAQELSEEVKEEILGNNLMVEDRFVVLLFDKADKFFVEISKNKNLESISIIEHPFWEADKLLDYVSSIYAITFEFDAKEFLLEVVNNTYIDFLNICSQLSLNYNNKTVSKSMLDELVQKNRVDNFAFARMFGFKQSGAFFAKLKEIEPGYEEIRSLFYFLQTHMLKIASTDHIYKKSKQSKYDKQILEQSKMWKTKEIELSVDFLKNIEFLAKTKNSLVFNDLKSSFMKSQIRL